VEQLGLSFDIPDVTIFCDSVDGGSHLEEVFELDFLSVIMKRSELFRVSDVLALAQ